MENKEFIPLEELFRRAFEDLPDTPSPSGWDVPSPHVWEGIHKHLRARPRLGGNSYTIWILVGALSTALFVGLWWWNTHSSSPPEKSALPLHSSEEAAVDTDPRVEEIALPVEKQSAKSPAKTPKQTRALIARPTRKAAPLPLSSLPLPGSVPAPNTTIRLEVEALRRAPWARPLSPLPMRTSIPRPTAVPPAIRELVMPEKNE
ncbi:MAG: hypothetical protein NZM43_12410 [Saprospiraceae bacterium]|nr:hypothetical protein [Saprospiraceae bacterium]MDW8485115.1 hypothetical protein [Saprospiraceae bacterium]